NIVLVLDNSYSMKKRNAVRPLLNAIEEFLKIVRPIDNIQVVVFDGKGRVDANGRPMRVRTLPSKSVTEIRHFLQNSYDKGLTDSTYLYEAMAAGIDLIGKIPDKKNRFLLVFSDGDDINSNVDRAFVKSMAQSAGEFTAYAVDYMPTEKLDPFLRSFSETQGGMAWKAASADTLVPIFKSFSTTLLYRYIVTYRFSNPPTGTLALAPEGLDVEMLTTLDGSPVMNHIFFDRGEDRIPDTYVQFSDRSQTAAFGETAIDSVFERYLNVLNVVGKRLTANPSAKARIIGCNASVGVEKGNLTLSQRRAVRVRDYLVEIWGIDSSRLELGIRNLPQRAAPIDALGGPAENQRVEIVYDLGGLQRAAAEDFVVTKGGVKGFNVRPDIEAEYGVATWEVSLLADEKLIRNIRGTGELQSDMFFSLPDLGIRNLGASNSLQARINVTDINGDVFEATSNAVPIRVSKRVLITELIGLPRADLAFEPESLVIEEVTAIDSSPLLNFVYFDSGQSVIPDRYVLFKDKAKTLSFSEKQLKGTIEKSYHMLNIVGKRLREHASAASTLAGCNSGYGPERKNLKLSRSRAEAVAAYLNETWGIDSSRMTIKARNLPAAPSTGRISEGRLENQRMEIHSEAPGILDTVKSTYVEETGSSETLSILPRVRAGYGVSSWRIDLSGGGPVLKSFNGEGNPESAYAVNLKEIGLKEIGAVKVLTAGIEVTDRKGETYRDPEAASISVTFIKREERVAKKLGYRVVKK
ncbi:MAG: OmpA family protein, partial [Deltaproteobacteria bacterium]|nr:OmpA family protein [Deltaproteobacteria bacterium]